MSADPNEFSSTQHNDDDNNNNNQQEMTTTNNEQQKPAAAAAEVPKQVDITMNDLEVNKARGYPDNFIKTSKYTMLTFVPLNLIHQFLKLSNFYFLLNMIVSLIPGVSPINPATSVVPLLFVVGVALVKDGYEDYLRHKADDSANSIPAHVVRKQEDGSYAVVDVESRDVQVGDIMMIKNGEELRADVLLLSSTGVESSSFIETCNLDGETNLKNRKAVAETWKIKDVESAVAAKVEVITGEPSPALLHWTGVIHVDGKEVSVGLDQFLYRSCILKNTEEAWGVVLYAGVDTKMFRNLEEKPPKFSNLDIKLNWLILAVFILQIVLLIILASMAVNFNSANSKHWYMKHYIEETTGAPLWGLRFLTYFILMSYLIPISLFVTLELCKVAQAQLMEWDHEMFEWMHGKWQHCTANTSNLNEQLSQVKFIFSDKTGTLTENVMRYSLGDALGIPIDADDFDASKSQMNDERMQRYMRALGLCHTIQPFEDEDSPSGLKYDGASPDEIALVNTAVAHGVELRERYTRSMKLRYNETGKELDYEILATLEFTPDRKMMSIVVRNPENGKIEIYTKGADSFVIPRCRSVSLSNNTNSQQGKFASSSSNASRVIAFASRELSQQEFDTWSSAHHNALCQIENREEKIRQVVAEIERDFDFIGFAALDEQLQDDVAETVKFFHDAKIKVWVVTGDTDEDHVLSVAKQSGILFSSSFSSSCSPTTSEADPTTSVIVLSANLRQESSAVVNEIQSQFDNIKQQLQEHKEENKKITLLIPEHVFRTIIINTSSLSTTFFSEIAPKIFSGICYGFSPIQKAQLVQQFQSFNPDATTLAIGDGENDIGMMTAASIGVGVMKNTNNNNNSEHSIATVSADYVLPKFKHLRRLLAVHGRTSLFRNSQCILFSLYKSFLICTALVILSVYKGLTGASIFDGLLFTIYNIIFLSIPPALVGFFGKDCPEELSESRPELYTELHGQNFYLKTSEIVTWSVEAVIHAVVIFFTMYEFLFNQDMSGSNCDGRTANLLITSTVMMSVTIFTALAKFAVQIRYFQPGIALSFLLTSAIYFIYLTVYSNIELIQGSTSFLGIAFLMWREPKFWLFSVLATFGMLTIDLFITSLSRHYINPHVLYQFDEAEFLKKLQDDCVEKKEKKEEEKKRKEKMCRFSSCLVSSNRNNNNHNSNTKNSSEEMVNVVSSSPRSATRTRGGDGDNPSSASSTEVEDVTSLPHQVRS